MALQEVRGFLERAGVVMKHDARWPSVTTMVAGEPVRGSWWGHPAGHAIFGVLQAMHDEVAWPKLLSGKVTLVHRRLWPALAAVGSAGEDWQVRGLRDDAADVLELVTAESEIRADDIALEPGCRTMSAIVTDLERRLLVVADQEHTASGKHVRVLRRWKSFARGLGRLPTSAAGRSSLEDAVVRMGGRDALRMLLGGKLDAVVRVVLCGMLAGCAAEPEACPAGALGCSCFPDGACNAGFECADDRVCRDDEPPETGDTTATTATTLTTFDDTTVTTFDPTIDETVTTSPTGTDTGETTSTTLPCVCGWSEGQGLYTCGEGLPPDGPGEPVCPTEGFLVGGPCDSVDPPITAEGCCLSNAYVAFCHPETSTIELQQCRLTVLGCAPAS